MLVLLFTKIPLIIENLGKKKLEIFSLRGIERKRGISLLNEIYRLILKTLN